MCEYLLKQHSCLIINNQFQAAVATANSFANLPGPGYPIYRLPIIAACKELLGAAGIDSDLVCVGLCDNYGPHVRKKTE